MLFGNYIVFTILVIVIFITAIALAFFGNKLNLVDYEKIEDYENLLVAGKYEEFPIQRLFGTDSSIAILNEKGETVYNSGTQEVQLSLNEIACIPDAISNSFVDTDEIQTSEGKQHYEIRVSSGISKQDVFILDENYKIIYSSQNFLGEQLSEKEYLLLSNKFFDGYTVNKYPFHKEDGKRYQLLLFRSVDSDWAEVQKLGTAISEFGIYFIVLYIFLIVLLVFWLKKKINKPLQLLCNTFDNYHVGKSLTQNYSGPQEFVDIFDNFSSMAHRLEESEKQKKSLEENRQKMIADIVHDFKTPIAVIQGYAKAVADGVVSEQEQKKYLSIINQKSSALNELILTFYEFSKMEHPDFKLHLQKTDICNYFRDFVAEQYFELENAGFEVQVEIPEEHVTCNVDRFQLKRAFTNIAGNSVKHIKPGSTLYFGLIIEEKKVILTLADNGSGIPKDIADKIFTPFVVGNSSRKGEGSGLGLSISKKIIELHEGTVELIINTDLEWKTKFNITLPRV